MISWHNSIAARYAAISLIAAIGPTLFVGGAYDRYSTGLVETLTGERLDRRLAIVSSHMAGFLDARTNQLETLVNYPGIGALVNPRMSRHDEAGSRAVIELEADQPDLYGILLFGADGALITAIPSQAASGPPYWGGADQRMLMAARNARRSLEVPEILGPFPPSEGRPASILMVRAIPGPMPQGSPLGWIALHIRLASLTEMMGTDDPDELYQTVLLTQDGQAYSNVGLLRPEPVNSILGPPLPNGWTAAMIVDKERVAAPLQRVRKVLMMVTILVSACLLALFIALWQRLTPRVRALVDGSQEIAAGNLSAHIDATGKDEIASVAQAFNLMTGQLQKLIHSAVEAEKMAALGRFATSLAHEVRNPLSTVKTTVQALLATEPKGEKRDILIGMDDEIDRLDDTLHDLLTYARPRPPQHDRVLVWELLERIKVMATTLLQEQKVSLVPLGESDIRVFADGGQLRQIMMNLILNALQAMEGGGLLTIRVRRERNFGVIEITDTGAGMPEEVLSRVTEPFFTTRHDGTGLGLSISRQLAELNGGSLQFFSAVGQGTTVMLTLPLAE